MAGLALLFQSVAVSVELNDVGRVNEAVEHRRSECGLVPKVSSHCVNGSLLVRITLDNDLEEVAGLIAR